MTERRLSRSSGGLGSIILALATGLLLVAAAGIMFSVFMLYDDEGYVLQSYRAYLEHGALYRDVYTQYGPFPFVFYQVLDALGLDLTHTAGRLVTLTLWLGAALGCAALVGQATRNLPLRLAVIAAAFPYLWVLASEPSHPGGLIVGLTVALALFGYRWLVADQLRAWALTAGAVTAILILTKINVGGFAALAVVAWWALHHTSARLRQLAAWLLPLAAIALPLGLMRPLLGVPWVQTFAAVFAGSAIAVIVTIARTATPRTTWAHAGWATLGGMITAGLTLGVIFARGTGPADLIEGILLGPLRHPVTFSLRYVWPTGILVATALSMAIAVTARLWHRRKPELIDTAVAALRLLAALALAFNVVRYPLVSPDYAIFGWAMPGLWLFLWPLIDSASTHVSARAWVGLLLLGQCLHVFPVPGSQIAWGSLLALPLAAIGGWEAIRYLGGRIRFLNSSETRRTAAARIAAVVVVVFAAVISVKFVRVATRYHADEDLGLPGAESLRLPGPFSAALRVLVVNAATHADVLFSFPGMFSFNLWSGVPTPTRANVTHWFSLLTADQQKAIINALAAHPRAAVIVHREHVRFLTGRGLTPRGPLRDYIEENFVTAFTVDDYEFRVHRGRSIHPFFVCDVLQRSASAAPQEPDTLLQLPVLMSPGTKISRVEMVSGEGPNAKRFQLDGTHARVEATPLTIRGTPAGAATPQTWPIAVEGPTQLAIYYDHRGQPPPARDTVIVLRGIDGATLATARLRP